MTRFRTRLATATGAVLCALLTTSRAEAACTVSTTSMPFGVYNVFSTTHTDSIATITYSCDKNNEDIVITLNSAGGGTTFNRRMLRGTERLFYNLFTDALRMTVWGDGTAGTQTYSHNNLNKNVVYTVRVYGRIPALQDVSAGSVHQHGHADDELLADGRWAMRKDSLS